MIDVEDYQPTQREQKVRKRRNRKALDKPFKRGGGKDKRRESEEYRKELEDFMNLFEGNNEVPV